MKYLLATLAFFTKYPGWNSFSKTDINTKRAVKKLVSLGYLEINKFNQARFTGKIFV